MPRQPDFSQHVPDPGLEPYRDRVARLFRGEDEVGLLLVRIDAYAEAESGWWWWTRWGRPSDLLALFWTVDGEVSDSLVGHVSHQDIERELEDYAAGRFRLRGEVLRASWTTPEESAYLRRSEFGFDD